MGILADKLPTEDSSLQLFKNKVEYTQTDKIKYVRHTFTIFLIIYTPYEFIINSHMLLTEYKL